MNAPRTRVQRRPVHGVLLLDKPLELSSNDALQKVKWLLRAEKAGHTGTLDPLATGVLPLCFGAATKFSQLQLEAAKTYEAIARLGQTTTTADAEGEVLRERAVDLAALTAERLAAVQAQFTGAIRQVPPMYSALKKDGKALYEYARAGIEVERPGARSDNPRTGAFADARQRRPACDPDAGDLQQGHLHPHAGRGRGRGPGLRRAPARAAPYRHRGAGCRALYLAGGAGRHGRGRASAAVAACRRPCWPATRLSRWASKMRPVFSRACPARALGPMPRRWLCMARTHRLCWEWGAWCVGNSSPGACSVHWKFNRFWKTRRAHDAAAMGKHYEQTNPQYRDHRPRGPRQNHHGGPAAAPIRNLRRTRESRGHGDGQQRHRTRAWHHHPGQELRRELERDAHQHPRHTRPRGLRR